MRILLQSTVYWPNLGGIETVARLLAEEFAVLGHSVVVLTDTRARAERGTAVAVLRNAPLRRRLAELRKADVVLMFGTSLRFLPLPLLERCPTVVSHHGWYDGPGPAEGLKRMINRATSNIAPSQAVARVLRAPAIVIPNPYDDVVFHRRPEIERKGELVFLGRLVSDKGLLLLIEALALLARGGDRPTLTVIGVGPEEASCRHAAVTADVDRQIKWVGSLRDEPLAVELSSHRVLVVPSIWREPFGVVALEGLACGCAVVGSAGGGLPEAMGPGGRTFPNGDAPALAAVLRMTLRDGQPADPAAIEAHLERHSPRVVARRYLEVLDAACR